MKKTALYIGRFQPFHIGHADAIDQILERNDIGKIFIGIGSAEDNYQPQNPLTAGERFAIIEAALLEKNIPAEKFSIVPIRNINHYALWPTHVQQYLPPIDILFSGSPLVCQLWAQAFVNSEVVTILKRKNISGTLVREKIMLGEKKFLSKFLLNSTEKFLEEFEVEGRLRGMGT